MRLLTLERSGPAAIVSLNRPEQRNALSLDLMHALVETLGIIEHDPDVRAVILAGEGTAFSSGHDLNELKDADKARCTSTFEVCTELMLKLKRIPQPTIAEVHGVATAAGCQLVAACDLAIASKTAKFATPGVCIGLFCATPMVPLVRAVGRKRAMQMLVTGEPIDAKTALAWGLVNAVVPAKELRAETLALAGKIAEASGDVVAAGKRAFYDQIDLEEGKAYKVAKEAMVAGALKPDAREGITAFLEKRQPAWSK
jgi:enoyl-CoA hydratase/carnithine racemase